MYFLSEILLMVPEKILAYLVENLAVGYKSTFKSTCYQFMQYCTPTNFTSLYLQSLVIFQLLSMFTSWYWRVHTLYKVFSHSLYRNLKQTKYLELKQDKGQKDWKKSQPTVTCHHAGFWSSATHVQLPNIIIITTAITEQSAPLVYI